MFSNIARSLTQSCYSGSSHSLLGLSSMTSGKVFPPTTFMAHSNKLRAKYLEKIASMTLQQFTPARTNSSKASPPETGTQRVIYPIRSGLRKGNNILD